LLPALLLRPLLRKRARDEYAAANKKEKKKERRRGGEEERRREGGRSVFRLPARFVFISIDEISPPIYIAHRSERVNIYPSSREIDRSRMLRLCISIAFHEYFSAAMV